MTNTTERGSVIRLCMYVYVCVYIYVCVCVHAHSNTCMYSQACTHAQCWCGMCVRRVSNKEKIVCEITILPAYPTPELPNLLTDCHETVYERS